MTKILVLYWQSIPTLVEARDINGIEKIELSKRFSELVDLIAMKKGIVESEDYLNYWKKKRMADSKKSAKEIVIELSEYFESDFDNIKSNALKLLN